MQDQNCHKLPEKERETRSLIEDISTKVLSLLPSESVSNLDSLESALTSLLDRIRKQATEQHFKAKDAEQHFCEICGQQMGVKEMLSRKIVGLAPYEIRRRSFYCDHCHIYDRPLDKILNLSGRFSLEIRKAMLLLGQRIPFQEASDYLDRLLGVQVSDQSILSLVESVGKQVHSEDLNMVRETLDKQGFVKEAKSTPVVNQPDTAYLQMDGMMVQTREDGWKEIRNGLLFSQDQKIKVDNHHHWIQEKTCFSIFNRNKNSLEAFKRRATAEAHHFGFDQYEKPVIIGDGAKWIWDYADEYHPQAIQILDYFHACEYLGTGLVSIETGKKKKKSLFNKLKAGKIKEIIEFMEKQKQTKEIKDCIRYFGNNLNRMNYGRYAELGLDVGSGAIESTHKTMIQSRMKQAGMHWKKKNVQSIASVKARVHSGRWDEMVNKHLKAA